MNWDRLSYYGVLLGAVYFGISLAIGNIIIGAKMMEVRVEQTGTFIGLFSVALLLFFIMWSFYYKLRKI